MHKDRDYTDMRRGEVGGSTADSYGRKHDAQVRLIALPRTAAPGQSAVQIIAVSFALMIAPAQGQFLIRQRPSLGETSRHPNPTPQVELTLLVS